MNPAPDFRTFFHALWGHDPFPWQVMLSGHVQDTMWPEALDLPTASGKTACIDVAIHAIAREADRAPCERTAPRRIWFVVDRRIVVDEAFDRASAIATKLMKAHDGALRDVADRLRAVAGTARPLAVARLRGGIVQDHGWARLASQPAVITSTVDQVGSCLLFRGYGHSVLTAPVYAALAANDSLIVLDEAHCSVPFLQTLRSIKRYRGERWAEVPIRAPFACVVLSATPPTSVHPSVTFPGVRRDAALDHPVLRRRLKTAKHAALVEVKQASRTDSTDPLVVEAASRTTAYVEDGRTRIGVIVNRVRTAVAIAKAVEAREGPAVHVVLLTGRIRPFERDALVANWKPYLRADKPQLPDRPIVLVCTQCLEVGADFSFDALISEAASLDALRQRFGRLARMGADEPAPAAVLVRSGDLEDEANDPIYGNAIRKTWRCLMQRSIEIASRRVVDLGVEALDRALADVEDLHGLVAPAEHAPALLPAHLDLLCQTAPAPAPEPDVSRYLHGKPGPPEVRIVWRSDLPIGGNPAQWIEILGLCPPTSGEMLSVPLWRARAWLAGVEGADDAGDVEGAGGDRDTEATSGPIRPCLLWRGRDRSRIASQPSHIAPGDVVVVPEAYGIAALGQSAPTEALGAACLDLWEPALRTTGRGLAVRIQRYALGPWMEWPPLKDLVELSESDAWSRSGILDAIDVLLGYPRPPDDSVGPPKWWLSLLNEIRVGRFDIEEHPAGGLILVARDARHRDVSEPDLFADDDDLTSVGDREVPLTDHTALVVHAAERLVAHCLDDAYGKLVALAAKWHDSGKLDGRFQVLLHNGDEVAAAVAQAPLAKSRTVAISPTRRRALRQAVGLPADFRHELLSVELARRHGALAAQGEDTDLVLHLIASHHGHARPFGPVVLDQDAPAISGQFNGADVGFSAEERAAIVPPHRIDAGLADRFWRLNRRYGWWGLAYLEAMLRLADWYGSRFISDETTREGAAS